MSDIDQILVRRVGGWVLVSPDDWLALGPGDQAELLAQNAVQFFAAGAPVDPEVAVPALAPAEAVVDTGPPPVELVAVDTVAAVYLRTVIEGPAYEIRREDRDGSVLFHRHRGRPDEYDLGEETGTDLLATDLIADALGIGDDPDLGEPAVRHFVNRFYRAQMGNRVWSVDAKEIRENLRSNPHLVIITTG